MDAFEIGICPEVIEGESDDKACILQKDLLEDPGDIIILDRTDRFLNPWP